MGSYAEHRVEATEHGGAARLGHTATPTKRQSLELPSAHEATCEAEVVQKKCSTNEAGPKQSTTFRLMACCVSSCSAGLLLLCFLCTYINTNSGLSSKYT
jgi:hypothetical protein